MDGIDKQGKKTEEGSAPQRGEAASDQEGGPAIKAKPWDLHQDGGDDCGLCLDPGPDFDDTEGWMSEREDYWKALPADPMPSRASWLRHGLAKAAAFLRNAGVAPAKVEIDTRAPESEWIRLYDEEFGAVEPKLAQDDGPLPSPQAPAAEQERDEPKKTDGGPSGSPTARVRQIKRSRPLPLERRTLPDD